MRTIEIAVIERVAKFWIARMSRAVWAVDDDIMAGYKCIKGLPETSVIHRKKNPSQNTMWIGMTTWGGLTFKRRLPGLPLRLSQPTDRAHSIEDRCRADHR